MRNGSGTYYDSAGRPTRWDHIDTATTATVVGFDLTYDRMGNPTAINFAHDTNHDFSDLDYDSSNRLVAMERPDNWTGQPDGEQWTLDGRRQLVVL